MVVKMMKWSPWPPILSKKCEVRIVVGRIQGFGLSLMESDLKDSLVVGIKWKGQRSIGLSSLRRSGKRGFTKEGNVGDDGFVEWNEEFNCVCNFSGSKEGLFTPWEVAFGVFNVLKQGSRHKVVALGTASLNLADFASVDAESRREIITPIRFTGDTVDCSPSVYLCLSLSLVQLSAAEEASEKTLRSIIPTAVSPRSAEGALRGKDEPYGLKAGLRKVQRFTNYMSARRARKACHEEEGSSDGRYSLRSEDTESIYPFDTDSLDDDEAGESEESKEDCSVRRSLSYETLAYANYAGGSFYFSNCQSDVGFVHVEDSTTSVCEQSSLQNSKRGIFSWRKRKLGFRSPKSKGEPLLKKDYGEDGGDDIDFDRRQPSSSDESSLGVEGSTVSQSSVSDFGDDNFCIGSWEHKEFISRDGQMKLQTQAFFASIDQRSERAKGESACTALVAVIADWLLSNKYEMPIKSEFDGLIRDGSLEWRALCNNEAYREQFPDKHFDLETVLQGKIRPLSVVPEKSFIGFFHPEQPEEGVFDILQGSMSFDNIWDEINRSGSGRPINSPPLIYIVSWNDHFFVLKVEQDAYYIFDTLGERLYEGCNQAYVLKFDKDTTLQRVSNDTEALDDKPANDIRKSDDCKDISACGTLAVIQHKSGNIDSKVVCRGKESCKYYIKNFLAAIPIKELQTDMKKGLMTSTPLHHRLQIEFHYTLLLQPAAEYMAKEVIH